MSVKLGPGLAKSPRQTWEADARFRFVRARRAIGTQQQVAIQLGVSRQAVEDWERGAAKVPGWALVAIEREAA